MRDLKLLIKLYKLTVKQTMVYKLDFLIGFFAMCLTNLTSVAFFWILFDHIPSINGWLFNEVLFVVGMAMVSMGAWHTFLSSAAFWTLEKWIQGGEFDRVLVRPVSPLRYTIIHYFDDDGLGELLSGTVVLVYAASLLSIQWTPFTIFSLIVFLISGTIIIFSIFLSFSTTCFWVVKGSAIGDIIFNLIDFIFYPMNILGPIGMMIFTFFIPLAFVSFYPAEYILGRGSATLAFAAPVVAIISYFIAKYFWDLGIKKYNSTGS